MMANGMTLSKVYAEDLFTISFQLSDINMRMSLKFLADRINEMNETFVGRSWP